MGAVIQNEDVLFYTIGGALRFAYEQVMYQICKTSSIGSTGATTGPRLTPHDLHTVAGMIFAEVERLPHLERNMVIAYYSLDAEERKPAVEAIAKWLMMQQPTGIHQIRMFIGIVEMYCGRGQSIREMAQAEETSKSDLHRRKGKLFRLLDEPFLKGKMALEDKLRNMLRVESSIA